MIISFVGLPVDQLRLVRFLSYSVFICCSDLSNMEFVDSLVSRGPQKSSATRIRSFPHGKHTETIPSASTECESESSLISREQGPLPRSLPRLAHGCYGWIVFFSSNNNQNNNNNNTLQFDRVESPFLHLRSFFVGQKVNENRQRLKKIFLRCSSIGNLYLTNVNGKMLDVILNVLGNVQVKILYVFKWHCNYSMRSIYVASL